MKHFPCPPPPNPTPTSNSPFLISVITALELELNRLGGLLGTGETALVRSLALNVMTFHIFPAKVGKVSSNGINTFFFFSCQTRED